MTTIRFQISSVAAIAVCLAVTVIFASCKKDEMPDLNGMVTITPTADVYIGDELTATYSGSETVMWQWNMEGAAINGATSNKYTPTEAGNYTATASATGYNSKTSAAVEVENLQNLNGTVTISPTADVYIGVELTATYGGSETVMWQWNKDGTAINGATSNKYTSAEAGSYTATASATGYNSKTSTAVEVTLDPRLPFFGKWIGKWDLDWTLTFSTNEIRVETSGGGWYKVSPIIWTAVTNTNTETKEDYPSGYKITGLVSENDGSPGWSVGDDFGDDWAYYLHKDGNFIIEQGDNNDWYEEFTKDVSGIKKTNERLTGALEQTRMHGSNKMQ